VYAEFPETTCENCARCCFESPGIFFVEYLNLTALISRMRLTRQRELLRRAFGELFFSWIDAERQCVFLESSRCAIYDERPLACRLFGLVAPADRGQAEIEARLAARQEARRLKLFGIEVPQAVVERSLASCDRVRDQEGRPVRLDADAIAARIATLDCRLLPKRLVMEEFCFRSLPDRLGMAAFGPDVVDVMRVQLLRRAQCGESVEDLLDVACEHCDLPPPLGRALSAR
jgi:Fe-S-cluster containining protein